jgi:hypothetical protein
MSLLSLVYRPGTSAGESQLLFEGNDESVRGGSLELTFNLKKSSAVLYAINRHGKRSKVGSVDCEPAKMIGWDELK